MDNFELRGCNCFAIRKAARRLTQAYDAALAPAGIRSTQYSILVAVHEHKELSVNDLAKILILDRTTMGKNLLPLVRDGLLDIAVSETDRRSRKISVTRKGKALLARAFPLWERANLAFQRKHGSKFSSELRTMLKQVYSLEA